MSLATPPARAADPRTDEGRRIAARNATTHGLFARDLVLPRLGEDPAAYEAFLAELTRQLAPKNLLEQHYAEKIAAASWRLRRLHRWQAQLFEDVDLLEDEVMAKLDREQPRLFEGRVREDLIRRMNATEQDCRKDPYMDQWITEETRKRSSLPTSPPSLNLSRLDTAPMSANCENEPATVPPSPWQGEVARDEPEGVLHTNCQNEPAFATAHPLPQGEMSWLANSEGSPNPPVDPKDRDAGGPCEARNECSKVVGISAIRKARRFKQQNCQNELAPCAGVAYCAPTPQTAVSGRRSVG